MRKTFKRRRGGISFKKLATAALLSGRPLVSAKRSHMPITLMPNRTTSNIAPFSSMMKNRGLDDMEITSRDVPMDNENEDIEIFVTEIPSPKRSPLHNFEIIQSDVPMSREKCGDNEVVITELPSPRRSRKPKGKRKNKKKSKSYSKSRK